jgi:hypothetical protein
MARVIMESGEPAWVVHHGVRYAVGDPVGKRPAHWWQEKDHPIWGIAKICLIIGVLTAYLKITATNFDHTELKAIGLTLLAALGSEWKSLARK